MKGAANTVEHLYSTTVTNRNNQERFSLKWKHGYRNTPVSTMTSRSGRRAQIDGRRWFIGRDALRVGGSLYLVLIAERANDAGSTGHDGRLPQKMATRLSRGPNWNQSHAVFSRPAVIGGDTKSVKRFINVSPPRKMQRQQLHTDRTNKTAKCIDPCICSSFTAKCTNC
ncbi:hypothetical protein J6590_080126 [Homalodisca vitripennis]|nr:hypothetical protein J6590_080126 [Homalodisca vitripennis]